MSGTLSADAEFRYIVQWFNEWSELQKEDFIPILVELLKDEKTVYVNGIVNSIANADCNEKPLNLFQCRIKLFKEWSAKWSNEMKDKLKDKVIELDPKVGEKLIENLNELADDVVDDNEEEAEEENPIVEP